MSWPTLWNNRRLSTTRSPCQVPEMSDICKKSRLREISHKMKRSTSERWAISWSGPASVSRTSIWSAFNSRMSAVQARDDRNLKDNLNNNNLTCLCRNVCLHQHINLAMDFYRKRLTVQFSSVAQSCPTLCDPKDSSMPGLPVHRQLPEFTQTYGLWVSDAIHLILCCPLLPLPSIFPNIRVFSNESALLIRRPKYWSFNFNINLSNEHSGLIFFRMDWLDLLAVQRTLKSLFQHHRSKASILQRSTFFIVQLSHPYVTTGKTIVLTRWTIVGKVISLFFNMLSRLVITSLPRSKRHFISWLQLPSVVLLEFKKIKSDTVSTVAPSICQEVMVPDAMILVFWMLSFKPTFSLSSFTFIKRLFSSSSPFVLRVVSSAYLRLLIFLLSILIPACASSSPTFHMM